MFTLVDRLENRFVVPCSNACILGEGSYKYEACYLMEYIAFPEMIKYLIFFQSKKYDFPG